MRKVTTMFFDYNVAHKIVAAEADVSLGETIFLEAAFFERSFRFDLPTSESDGAAAWLAFEVKGAVYEVAGTIKDNKIIVKLTPDYIQLGSVLDCWFVWKVGDKVSPRFPLKLRVVYSPFGFDPPPEIQPPPIERFVTVADQGTGKVSPPVVEGRIAKIEEALEAVPDLSNVLEVADLVPEFDPQTATDNEMRGQVLALTNVIRALVGK